MLKLTLDLSHSMLFDNVNVLCSLSGFFFSRCLNNCGRYRQLKKKFTFFFFKLLHYLIHEHPPSPLLLF